MLLSQYIDDCHIGQLRIPIGLSSSWSIFLLSAAACFITSLVILSRGYFIGLQKSVLLPVQIIPFLGLDFLWTLSSRHSFSQKRRNRICQLWRLFIQLESYFNQKSSKICRQGCFLFFGCAKLYCREVNYNISKGLRSSRPVND